MKKIETSKIFYLLTLIGLFSACQKNVKTVDFTDICHAENHEIVEIKGFLHLPNSAITNTPDLTSNQFLLLENENGTGGFIGIENNNQNLFSSTNGVKIRGEVLKKENSCVLRIEKIETP